MKLCQKCTDAINKTNREDLSDAGWTPYSLQLIKTVEEIECEFWAHKELNGWRAWRLKQKAEGTDDF